MIGELRALGIAQGLTLGMLIACPIIAPDMLPWAIDAWLLIGGFQLRLADRRFTLRTGGMEWVSHIRMAPWRLVRWGVIATVALIAGDGERAMGVAIAGMLCELVAYPLSTQLLGRRSLPWASGALAMLIVLTGVVQQPALHMTACFLSGIAACMMWLRGPDGDPRALALALGGGVAAAIAPMLFPGALPFAAPTFTSCAAWVLAYLSVLRRQVTPWRPGGAAAGLHPSR